MESRYVYTLFLDHVIICVSFSSYIDHICTSMFLYFAYVLCSLSKSFVLQVRIFTIMFLRLCVCFIYLKYVYILELMFLYCLYVLCTLSTYIY